MLNKFQTKLNGNSGLAIFTKMATIVVATSISMLAKGEGFAFQSVSEKTNGVLQNKVEIRALPRPATGSIEQCGQIMRGVSDQSEQVKRVRKTLKKNLHFRPLGDGHMILRPGWYSDYSDMVAAHSSMSEDDIPILVNLIGRGKLKDGMRSIGIGVLRIFGEKALPCIEAGMSIEEWYSSLSSTESGIKANIKYPDPHATVPSQKPDHQHFKTPKGGKQQ